MSTKLSNPELDDLMTVEDILKQKPPAKKILAPHDYDPEKWKTYNGWKAEGRVVVKGEKGHFMDSGPLTGWYFHYNQTTVDPWSFITEEDVNRHAQDF